MADLRVSAQPPAAVPARPVPAARAEAVRAAQRAFFETALAGDTQAASPPRAAAPTATAAPVRAEVRVAIDPAAPAPTRPLRPGSLLDIKV